MKDIYEQKQRKEHAEYIAESSPQQEKIDLYDVFKFDRPQPEEQPWYPKENALYLSKEGECSCAEMTCTKGCNRNHTHKGFSCEKCKPEEWESMFNQFWGYDMCNQKEFDKIKSFIKTEIRKAEEKKKQEILNALLKEARKTDYADRTEYDVAYEFIKNL